MIPVAFDGLSACLHDAPGSSGVILVSSPGFEDLCAHRMMVALGDQLASRGHPFLRVDLFGTGDSGGDEDHPDIVDRWIEDVATAAGWMRRELGCSDIRIAGLRLGALLAAAAAHRIEALPRLALLAPPLSGKAYLRELNVL